jgi:hypothetical protein
VEINITSKLIFVCLQSNVVPSSFCIYVECVPCHHSMARPQFADARDGLQKWRVAANILNKQSWPTDRGCEVSWEVWGGANKSQCPLP